MRPENIGTNGRERLCSVSENMTQVMHSKMATSISSGMFAHKAQAPAISFATIIKGKGEITARFQPGFPPICAAQPIPLYTKRCKRTKEDEPSNQSIGYNKAHPFTK